MLKKNERDNTMYKSTHQINLDGNELAISLPTLNYRQDQIYLMYGIPISHLRQKLPLLGEKNLPLPETTGTTIEDFVDNEFKI